MRQEWQNPLFQLLIQLFYGHAGIEHLETIFPRHCLVLLEQQRLVMEEAFKEVRPQAHIHARLPVIKAPTLQHTWYQVIDPYLQVKDSIRLQRQAINGANPPGVSSSYYSTRYQ